MAESTLSRSRGWAIGSAALGVTMLVIYLTLIVAERGNTFFDIFPWALLMTIAATVAVVAVLAGDRRMARIC